MGTMLVTGASGYIGQHLCLQLAEHTHVRALSRSAPPAHLRQVEWVRGDITDFETVTRAVKGCQAVVHLACASLPASTRDPLEAQRVNATGTLHLLEAARQAGTARVLYTSTMQVYGGQAPLPNVETATPLPDSPYAASKLAGELWAATYARTYGLPVSVLRLHSVYGPTVDRSARASVEDIFLRQLHQGQRPTIRGSPYTGRDFIYIQDVVRAIVRALSHPPWDGPLNIGTGVLTTLMELAQLAAQVVGCAIAPDIIDMDRVPTRFQADITRAQAVLGFQAPTTLAVGLQQLAASLA